MQPFGGKFQKNIEKYYQVKTLFSQLIKTLPLSVSFLKKFISVSKKA